MRRKRPIGEGVPEGHVAGADFVKGERAVIVRRFGRGAGDLKGDKPGPGVRASELKRGHEEFVHNTELNLTREEQERLHAYRMLLEDVERGLSAEDQRQRIEDIREKYKDELGEGGFLSPERINVLLQGVDNEEKARWPEPVRNMWDETIAALSQEDGSEPEDQ